MSSISLVVRYLNKAKWKWKMTLKITSRPMMAMAGRGRSQGPTLASAAIGGLVHNNTNVVATINCTKQPDSTVQSPVHTLQTLYTKSSYSYFCTQHSKPLPQTRTKENQLTLSATGSKNAPNSEVVSICYPSQRFQK